MKKRRILNPQERKQLFQQVAITQLQTRTAGVLKGTATGTATVCPAFLFDVAMITDSILKSSEVYANSENLKNLKVSYNPQEGALTVEPVTETPTEKKE